MRIRRIITSGIVSAFLVAPASMAQSGGNGQPVHRCVGHNGEIVFSGLACSADEAAVAPAPGTSAATAAAQPATCATSVADLRDRIATAIARHDPNALAGLLRWRGVSGGVANQRLRALGGLVKGPLIAIDGDDAADDPPVPGADVPDEDSSGTMPDAQLHVRTGSNEDGGVRDHTFGASSDGGCYWLDW